MPPSPTLANTFLGRGWSFPPAFSRASLAVEMVSDLEDINQSLRILLSTTLGERLMQPMFGTQLWKMVFYGMTNTLINELREMVDQAIVRWEPRIVVEDIAINVDPEVPGLVNILINYVVSLTNTRSNLVYPFYFQEASLTPQGP